MRKLYLFTVVLMLGLGAWAQTITLTFTGRDAANHHAPLSKVIVTNITQNWQETLYGPDTVLHLTNGVGVNDFETERFKLSQNIPNPFTGTTDVQLEVSENEPINVEITDMGGRKVLFLNVSDVQAGAYTFRVQLASPQTYLFTARQAKNVASIKMVNNGTAGTDAIRLLDFAAGDPVVWKKGGEKSNVTHPWAYGDNLTIKGFSTICGTEYSKQLSYQLLYSETIALDFDGQFTPPNVSQATGTNLTGNSVTLSATAGGNCGVTSRGFCYGTTQYPTLSGQHTTNGSGAGNFSANITGLNPVTTYYVRSYATNSSGTTYSNQTSIRTQMNPPTITTGDVTNISATTADCQGNVTDNGGGMLTVGICYSTSTNPTIASEHTTQSQFSTTGSFTHTMTDLLPATTYYVCAYATNNAGTGYGNQRTFTTPASTPTVVTAAISDISAFSATCGGNVSSDGGATVTARGVCWSTSQNPTISDSHTTDGGGPGSFISNITGLTPGIIYYVRAYATNSVGTAYGSQMSFMTTMSLPTVTTNSVTNITFTTASCGGNVTSDDGFTVTARGVCWSTSPGPTINDSHTTNGSDTGSFTSSMTGLTAGTTYYVRAYATNSVGTAYGNQVSFTTLFTCGTSTISDYDGNTYNTVQIGQQCWMKQNLRTTHYANGLSIIAGGSNTSTTSPYYYDYSSSGIALSSRGYLYNWPAVMHQAPSSSANPSGVQGICPSGWHVPSDAEWTQLINYVSSQSQYQCNSNSSYIAKALASTEGWSTTDNITCAVGNIQSLNNATDFSAVPAGYCYGSSFDRAGIDANFWSSSSQYGGNNAYSCNLYYGNADVRSYNDVKYFGLSVRCLSDGGGSSYTQLPTVTTTSVSDITNTTATSGGNVTSDGGVTVTARGVCWSTSPGPTINDNHTTNGSDTGSFTSSMTGLTTGTTYYVRAYATNSVGTAYGNQVSFIATFTCGASTVSDHDGNTYNTVQIGSQCWMKENLRTTHYSDGTAISLGSSTSTTVAYRYCPNNNSSNVNTYGYLYNWKAAMHGAASSSANPSGVQGICPDGWHVPSDAEWTQLTNHVSSQSQYQCNSNSSYIAKALASTTGWNNSTTTCAVGNNQSANNAIGFSAFPAGEYGYSFGFGECAYFWSTTDGSYYGALNRCLIYSNVNVYSMDYGKSGAFSVRCLRD